MDPFTLWLLGGVVIPDAYERVVNGLSSKSAEERLAKGIRADVGGYPKRVFRRWYRTREDPGCARPGRAAVVRLSRRSLGRHLR